MGYDRIYIESTEHPRGLLERREATTRNMSDHFYKKFNRLRGQGHFVTLTAGKNHLFDELFLFESPSNAREFFEYGYQKWESSIGDEDQGCGFQGVSLYRDGHLVATKSSAPTKLNRAEDFELLQQLGDTTFEER